MAVFGFQLLLTIIVLCTLNKLTLRYSFARWILIKGGLVYYLHPDNHRLKEAIAEHNRGTESNSKVNPKDESKRTNNRARHRKNRNKEEPENETFNVPKNLSLNLEAQPLNLAHLIQLPYYSELQWLIDFSLCAVVVYFCTELYYHFLPERASNEYNLSLVWCALALAFICKILFSITSTYFASAESMGERSMVLVAGCFFFLISMVVLIVDEELLEFGLVEAYRTFNQEASNLLKSSGAIEHAYGPTSFLMVKFWLAIWCGLLGALFTFPGLRVARMHKDALIYAQGNQITTTLYHFSFISPLVIVLLWIKPVARHNLTVRQWPNRGILLSDETFEAARLIIITLILGFRFTLFRKYLQAYLNIAPQKLQCMRRESGRITNSDLQKTIARVYYYVCVASLQYLTPLLMCLFVTLITKTAGELRWTGSALLNSSSPFSSLSSNDTTFTTNLTDSNISNVTDVTSENNSTIIANITDSVLDSINASNSESVQIAATTKLTLALFSKVFSPVVLRAMTGFLLWWSCSVWFATSVIGFVYHTYFSSL